MQVARRAAQSKGYPVAPGKARQPPPSVRAKAEASSPSKLSSTPDVCRITSLASSWLPGQVWDGVAVTKANPVVVFRPGGFTVGNPRKGHETDTPELWA